jgi:hypothetical protein
MLVSSDDQVKAYIKKIMSQLDKWMIGGKISKLVVVITSKDTGEHVERWQFDVCPSLTLLSHKGEHETYERYFNRSKYSPVHRLKNPLSLPNRPTKRTPLPLPPLPQPPPRKPKRKSNLRSNPSSGKSLLL